MGAAKHVRNLVGASAARRHNAVATTAIIVAGVAAIVVVAALAAFGEWIRIRSYGSLAQVDVKYGVVVVVLYLGARVFRVDGIACLPRRDPAPAALEIEFLAVATANIGDHVVVDDAGAGQELDVTLCVFGHNMTNTSARAQRDVAGTILVHEEDFGALHLAADAESGPFVGLGGAELEVDVARAGLDGIVGNAPAKTYLRVVANTMGGAGGESA